KRGAESAVVPPLSHHRRMLRLDLIEHANFAGLAVRIFVHAEIFLGELVDAIVGAFLSDLNDTAANFEIAIRVFRVDDSEGDAGITTNIAVLLPPACGIEDYMIAVEVNPDRSDLRTAVRHQRSEAGERTLLKKIFVLIGDGLRHECLRI